MQTLFRFVVLLIIPGFSSIAYSEDMRPFSVSDAISLTKLHEQNGKEISVSPTGQYFFTVTSRGDIVNNDRIFEINIYTVTDLQRLESGQSPGSLEPFRRIEIRTASNEAGVQGAKWVDDGDGIAFLGAPGVERPQVFHHDLHRDSTAKLTDAPLGVLAFDYRGGVCVYAAGTSNGVPDNSGVAGYVITDESLPTLIFPDDMFDRLEYSTYVISDRLSQPKRIHKPSTGHGFIYSYSISPDGRYAVGVMPPDSFPEEWNAYNKSPSQEQPDSIERRAFQFQLIDLQSLETKPLVDAPVSWAIWSRDRQLAIWSDDGSKLLLGSTMAPIADDAADERPTSLAPISVVVDLRDGDVAALHEVPLSAWFQGDERLVDGVWNNKTDQFSLYTVSGRPPFAFGEEEHWRLYSITGIDNGGWAATAPVSAEGRRGAQIGGLRIDVREDANTPPSLTVQFNDTAEAIVATELNPWLGSVELAYVEAVSWLDGNGQQWMGALTLPPDYQAGDRVPLVIQLKYSSPSQFKPDGPYTTVFATQALAAEGIAVLDVDATDQGTLHTQEEAKTQLRSIEAAIAHFADAGYIDRSKVALTGFSRTAYYVKYALTQSDFSFAAAALSDGIDAGYMQYLTFGVNYFGGGLAQDFSNLNGGRPYGPELEAWLENAPGFNVHRVNAPLRIEAIGRSSAMQEWGFYSGLRMLDKPVEMVYIPNGTHVLVKPAERLISQQGNVDWFRYWLLGKLPKETSATDATDWHSLKQLRDQLENQTRRPKLDWTSGPNAN